MMHTDTLIELANRMLGRGAPNKQDGMGFSKTSYSPVITILDKPRIMRVDYSRLAHHLIRHRGQLESMGVDIDELKALKADLDEWPYDMEISMENKAFHISMPYDKENISRLRKSVLGSSYVAPWNIIPLGSLIAFAKEFDTVPGMVNRITECLKANGINGTWIKENLKDDYLAARAYASGASMPDGRPKMERGKAYITWRGDIEMLVLAFDYDARILAAVKALPNNAREYDEKAGKIWKVSPYHHDWLLSNLKKGGIELGNDQTDVAGFIEENYPNQKMPVDMKVIQSEINTDEAMALVTENWSEANGRKLYPHQLSGVSFMLTVGNCINADQTGLGKSLEAIIAMQIKKEEIGGSALVIVPASLKINWMREITGNLGAKSGTVIIAETKRNKAFVYVDNYNGFAEVRLRKGKPVAGIPNKGLKGLTRVDWLIVNYDIAEKMRPDINDWKKEIGCKIICADEAHFLKNYDSSRTKAVLGWTRNKTKKRIVKDKETGGDIEESYTVKEKQEGIIEGMQVRYALTGTPITGRNRDLLSLLRFIEHPLATFPKAFLSKYCGPESNRFGITYDGSTNSEELYAYASSNMIQRRKQDVLDGFPLKQRIFKFIDVDTDKYWDYWYNYVADYSKNNDGKEFNQATEHLVEMQVLRRYASELKIPSVIEYAQQFTNEGRKVIIFTGYTATANALMEHYGSAAVQIVGGMSGQKKDDAVQAFQNDDKIRVIVCNFLAAGVGLTLTAASEVIMADLTWLPSDHFQAEDRAWRIGQKNHVTIHYLIAADTHEEDVKKAVDEKGHIIDTMENANYVAANEWGDIFSNFLKRAEERRAN